MIQPNYGTLTCAKKLCESNKIRVESVFKDLEEVKKPISLSANAFILSKEDKGGVCQIKAKVMFNLVYLSEDGYKKSTCEADGVLEVKLTDASVNVFVTDVKLLTSNGFVGVCTLNCQCETVTNTSVEVLTGGEGLYTKTKEVCLNIYSNERQGQNVISDEFNIDFTVGEVLCYGATAYLTSVTAELGRLVLEGEAILTVKVLPFSENNDIVKEKRVIPFRYELEDGDSLSGDKAYAFVHVLATNVKVLADEGRERSTVSVDITLGFTGGSVSCKTLSIVEDAYLKNNECELVKDNVGLSTFGEQRFFSQKVVCQGGVVDEGCRLVTVLGENFSVIAVKSNDGRVFIDGVLKVDAILKNSDNGIATVVCECPISVDFSVEGEIDGLRVVLADVNARIRNGEIELECHLKGSYREFFIQDVTYVSDVNEMGLRNNLDGAICVCVAKKGDELWDVAKKLGSDEQEISLLNPDLQFPLSSDAKIIIYRQKI